MRISDWSSDVCSSDPTLLCLSKAYFDDFLEIAPTAKKNLLKQVKIVLLRITHACRSALSHRTVLTPLPPRSAGRRVGKARVRTCRSRWSRCHEKTNKHSKSNESVEYYRQSQSK